MLKAWLLRHLQVLFFSIGQLARAPLGSLMTVAVIAIALALPSGLYVLVDNVRRLSEGFDVHAQVSLFLDPALNAEAITQITAAVRARPDVGRVDYLSPQQALDDFSRFSGFGDALEALHGNPLPPTLVVRPAQETPDSAAVDRLARELQGLPGVDIAQVDMDWVRRLHAVLALLERLSVVAAGLFGVAVILIVSNTIRLAIFNRREEIEIVALVGGTRAFIRRPFLYTGLLLGLLGACGAVLLVDGGLAAVGGPARELARLYGSAFDLQGLEGGPAGILLAAGGALGWLASRVTVDRHLARSSSM